MRCSRLITKHTELHRRQLRKPSASITKEIKPAETAFEKDPESMGRPELEKLIADVQKKMKKAAAELNFEAAAELRDQMVDLKKLLADMD